MARKMPSLIALVGMAALAGYKNRKRISKFIENARSRKEADTKIGDASPVARVRRPAA